MGQSRKLAEDGRGARASLPDLGLALAGPERENRRAAITGTR